MRTYFPIAHAEILATHHIDSGLMVQTDKQCYACHKLVLAVGTWAPGLFGDILPFPLHIERRVMFWFQPLDTTSIHWDDMPVYVWDIGSGLSFYGFPEDPSLKGCVKVAQHAVPLHPAIRAPEDVDREVSEEEVERMRLIYRHRMPGLDGELKHTQVCMYTMTPDEHL
jgi:sarcosine oxidase